jgi:2-dehydro-3-deoxyphosphogluconate aldolase/(4S)-4-hydroxy-2-oxoglutarate aldolase
MALLKKRKSEMPMSDMLELLKTMRIVPVVSLPSVSAATTLAEILVNNGLPVIEITFRTPHAAAGLAAIKKSHPQMLLLAGTVLTPQQVDLALEAGASAIVSPGFSPKLAGYCTAKKVSFFPGVCTPSEVQMAMEAGFPTLKFFPAEKVGGVSLLSLFHALYQHVTFMPTGGIKPENMASYLALPNVLCCGGTWLCPEQLMVENRWAEIERRVTEAVQMAAA